MKYYICKIQFSKLHVILKHYLQQHFFNIFRLKNVHWELKKKEQNPYKQTKY
jgi:hypothetical protein